MPFRPLNEYIAVQCEEDAEIITDAGLVIPQTLMEKARHQGDGVVTIGTVLAVGRGHLIEKGSRAGQFAPLECQVGDRILFPKHQLCPDLGNGQTVIHEQHVWMILRGDYKMPAYIRHEPYSVPARDETEVA